ncbi:MAG: hypothetical protein WCA19_11570 [Candidatus Acidiferrales bacterium]
MRKRFAVLALALLAVSVGVAAGNDDPLYGTWKLNVAKSKWSPEPPYQSEVAKIEPYGQDGIKWYAEIVNGEGKKNVTQFNASFDGSEFTQGSQTSIMLRVDRYTTERINKTDGKVTTIQRRSVSKDGKTLTITTIGTDPKGRAISNDMVFERQ